MSSIVKRVNYRELSKLTGLPRAILKIFVKKVSDQNSKDEIVSFYIDFLIFLYEENLYTPIDIVSRFYKEKKFINFKELIEDVELMDKFRKRNEKIAEEAKKVAKSKVSNINNNVDIAK